MDKTQFLQRLKELLGGMEPAERDAALEYYTEYLDDAGPGGEADALKTLGSPEKVAGEILGTGESADWAGPQRAGSYGTCCGDEAGTPAPEDSVTAALGRAAREAAGALRTAADRAAKAMGQAVENLQNTAGAEPGAAEAGREASGAGPGGETDAAETSARDAGPACGPARGSQNSGRRGNGALWLLLVVLTIPLWGGLFGVVLGVFGTLVGAFAAGIGLVAGAAAAVAAAVPLLTGAFADGVLVIGLSLLAAALGLVMLAGCLWCFSEGLPAAFRGLRQGIGALRRKVCGL